MDLSGIVRRLQGVTLVFAADVAAPLLGPTGATAVFAAQKGADEAARRRLEEAMRHWSSQLRSVVPGLDPQTPGAGAAGGTGIAGLALAADFRSGSDVCLELAGFDRALEDADLVITGEGRLDLQTLLGKVPFKIATRARAAHTPLVTVVGSCAPGLSPGDLLNYGFGEVYELVNAAPRAAEDVELSRQALRAVGAQVAQHISQASISH